MSPTTKQLILRALNTLRGDDYERALSAFRNCTPVQMKEVYGNGLTRQQLLDNYKKHVDEVEKAVTEVKNL